MPKTLTVDTEQNGMPVAKPQATPATTQLLKIGAHRRRTPFLNKFPTRVAISSFESESAAARLVQNSELVFAALHRRYICCFTPTTMLVPKLSWMGVMLRMFRPAA